MADQIAPTFYVGSKLYAEIKKLPKPHDALGAPGWPGIPIIEDKTFPPEAFLLRWMDGSIKKGGKWPEQPQRNQPWKRVSVFLDGEPHILDSNLYSGQALRKEFRIGDGEHLLWQMRPHEDRREIDNIKTIQLRGGEQFFRMPKP